MDMQLFFNLYVVIVALALSSAQVYILKDNQNAKAVGMRILLRSIQIVSVLAFPFMCGLLFESLFR